MCSSLWVAESRYRPFPRGGKRTSISGTSLGAGGMFRMSNWPSSSLFVVTGSSPAYGQGIVWSSSCRNIRSASDTGPCLRCPPCAVLQGHTYAVHNVQCCMVQTVIGTLPLPRHLQRTAVSPVQGRTGLSNAQPIALVLHIASR